MAVRVVISDTFGNRILQLPTIERVECTATYNKAGWFRMTFAGSEYPRGIFGLDRRVDIYRRARGRAERLIFCGYMRTYSEDSEQYAYTENYEDELTVVYYGGAGQEAARTFDVGATSADRLRASAINRREGFYQDTGETDTDVLEDGCEGVLYDNRPLVEFRPSNVEISAIYPNEFTVGDTLRIASGAPETITLGGPDMTGAFLAGRIVAYKSGTTEAKKDAAADDMMKEYVDENLLNPTDTDRELDAALGFEIAADQTAGPTVEYSAKFGNLLNVLQRVSDEAGEAGTRVYFAVIPVVRAGVIVPRFVTRVGQFGQDRTYLPIGSGDRASDLTVSGVRFLATRDAETVTPMFEEIDNE